MDLTTIKDNVVAWVTANKLTAGAIGLAVAGAVIYFVRSSSKKSLGSARPRALLSGTKRKTKRPKSKARGFQGLR